MDDEKLDEMERQIHEVIRHHREAYEHAIKPYIDQLVRIQSLRPVRLFVTRDQLASFAMEPFKAPPLTGEER